jgi:hypothetical protein
MTSLNALNLLSKMMVETWNYERFIGRMRKERKGSGYGREKAFRPVGLCAEIRTVDFQNAKQRSWLLEYNVNCVSYVRDGAQPILKYLFMVAVHRNSTVLVVNTQCRCDYARAHAGRVSSARTSLSAIFWQSKCEDAFCRSETIVHCRTLPGITFLLNLPEWV